MSTDQIEGVGSTGEVDGVEGPDRTAEPSGPNGPEGPDGPDVAGAAGEPNGPEESGNSEEVSRPKDSVEGPSEEDRLLDKIHRMGEQPSPVSDKSEQRIAEMSEGFKPGDAEALKEMISNLLNENI